MKARVALLSARPETILTDYERLLALAGLAAGGTASFDLLVAASRGRGWRPGHASPPWQLQGVQRALKADAGMVAVRAAGPARPDLAGHGWSGVLAGWELEIWSGQRLETTPYRPVTPAPSLEASLEKGLELSPHLRDRRSLLLPTMALGEGGRLLGAVELLANWLAPRRRPPAKTPVAEVLAEVVALAGELFPRLGVVCDATVWAAVRRGGQAIALDRHVLVAGADPVAVDAVLARLAGIRLGSLPWLALAQQRKLGSCDPNRLEIVGDTQLLDLDFQVPEDTFAGGKGGPWGRLAHAGPRAADGQEDRVRGDSPWERLFRDYQSGAIS